MKIDEPKTPYAKRYEPDEDEEEIRMLDAEGLKVDELDKVASSTSPEASTSRSLNDHSAGDNRQRQQKKNAKDSEIPGLELGEPEDNTPWSGMNTGEVMERSGSASGSGVGGSDVSRSNSVKSGEKSVEVAPEELAGHSGEVRHKDFEERRKQHYEMKDVRGLLG